MRAALLALILILAGFALAHADDLNVTKQWGTVDVTLKSYDIDGNMVRVRLLFRNNADESEAISSLIQFEVVSNEGEGKMDYEATDCDGSIPPHALLKCSLAYRFPTPPSSLILTVGAFERVYFDIGLPKTL
jgi:hypothetical protein